MINATQALHRVRQLEAFRHLKDTDFRPLTFVQIFTPATGAAPSASTPQNFPGGAIILGITASGFVPGATPSANRARQLFAIDFSFSNQEAIIVGGPVQADALLGGGESNIFPSKEMVMAPNQQVACRVANLTDGPLTVHVCYHTLVYRFAS
jgi:hypothetical protein